MKKFLLSILLILTLCLTGCMGKKGQSYVMDELSKKIEKAKSYYVEGTMELMNNEDIYEYDVKVSYKEGDFYKVDLTNKSNNHEQVILRNKEGVYVVTPSLNKSFKFQSDWPYNNSQSYLLTSLLDDLNNDETKTLYNKELKYNEELIVTGYMPLDSQLEVQEIETSITASKQDVMDKQTAIEELTASVLQQEQVFLEAQQKLEKYRFCMK